MTPEIQALIQWALAGLAACGYVVLWRVDASTRAAKKIQEEWRRNAAEQKHATDQLNQKRAAINDRYDDAVSKMRDKLGIK